jgi:NAD(P)-dependent dehydrogenase (short-subunit alcohol dehydrogenase family)
LTLAAHRGIIAQMPRTVLVTEGDSPLGGALIRLLAARGHTVATAVARAATGRAGQGSGAVALSVPWNRRSPLSARTVLLDSINSLNDIDEVLILEPPSPAATPLHETSSADIEKAFDDAKGPVFLAREALAHFIRRGRGLLCVVSTGAAEAPLECGMRECLRGVCSALMAATGKTGILVNGFQSGGAEVEEYAAFIDRTLEEKARKISGRWFTCPSRGGFFQGVLGVRTSSNP